MPAILSPFLGPMPHSLAQPAFPPSRLFSPAQHWKSPLSSPLPQPMPPGPAIAHLPWVIPSTQCCSQHGPPSHAAETANSHGFALCVRFCGVLIHLSKGSMAEPEWPGAVETWISSDKKSLHLFILCCHIPSVLFTAWSSGQREGQSPSPNSTSLCTSICYRHRHTTPFR